MPLLQEMYEKWKDKGLVVLAIHIGGNKTQVAEFTGSRGLSLPVFVDDSQQVSDAYSIRFFPTTYFIDKNGAIQDMVIGAFTNLEQIETRLTKITGS